MPLKPEVALRKDLTGARVTFQHRHFAVVAATLRDYFDKNTCSPELKEDVLDHWADAMARTNPKFDRARFLRACQP